MRKAAALSGQMDDAVYDAEREEIRVNVLGSAVLSDPLAPASLTVLLHELAHHRAKAHDAAFIQELERLAGRAARLLADRGAEIRERFGS
jgi:hypothetical protein